jgi:putative nucleotidyltransferase with HDIG domain
MRKRLRLLIPFVVAVAAIVAMMPREGKFKYQFHKGKEWHFPTLVAEFDFPLYKSDAELTEERDAALNSFAAYYDRDTAVAAMQTARFAADLTAMLRQDAAVPVAARNTWHNQLLPPLLDAVQTLYDKGIRNINHVAESYLDSSASMINVVTAHVAESVPIGETFLPAAAVRYIQSHVSRSAITDRQKEYVSKIPFADYLTPNLIYNDALTAAAQAERLRLISPTNGMISKGERIISKGDMVSNAKYRELDSYRHEYELRFGFDGNRLLLLLGQVLLVSLLIFVLYGHIYYFHNAKLTFKNSTFIMLLILLFFALSRWVTESNYANIYIIPFAILATYVCTFMGRRLALMVHIIAVLLTSALVPDEYNFVLMNIFVGVVATFYAEKSYRRSTLYMGAALIFTSYALLYITALLIDDGSLAEFSLTALLCFALNAGLVIASYQLIFIFEKTFDYISNTTLMEIADTNQPLLRMLAEKAPATFHHCIQVANLAETAAANIGGNPLLVRAGALYHDIGKMQNPAYFIENQASGYNPHTSIEPEESAGIIIRHVSDGIVIARRHRLPQVIIDFIMTHHGTSKTRYFYNQYKEKHPEATDFSRFSYSGRNPTTKEQAVLMLADVTEAASRSLTAHTRENINNLVEKSVDMVMNEKMLIDSPLTFADIKDIKATFKKKLQNIYHSRFLEENTPITDL